MSFSGSSGISLFSYWFRICEYDLFDTTNRIQNLIYTFWYRILYQFLVTGTSDLLYVSINSWDSQVLAYTPLSFFLYSPFKDTFSSLLLEHSSILREYTCTCTGLPVLRRLVINENTGLYSDQPNRFLAITFV